MKTLGEPSQSCSRFTYLADSPGHTRKVVGLHSLDGVDNYSLKLLCGSLFDRGDGVINIGFFEEENLF